MQVAKSLPSLSISRRMRLGFGGMLVLLGAVAAVGQLSVGKVHAQMRQITGVGAHKAQLVSGMRESVSAIGIQSRSGRHAQRHRPPAGPTHARRQQRSPSGCAGPPCRHLPGATACGHPWGPAARSLPCPAEPVGARSAPLSRPSP